MLHSNVMKKAGYDSKKFYGFACWFRLRKTHNDQVRNKRH